MKCSNCGSTNLFPIRLEGPTDDGWWHCDNITPFVCEECGHVEFYVNEDVIRNHKASVKRNLEIKKQKEELSKKISNLESEIIKLEKFVKDDNNTVKSVNAAKEKLLKDKEKFNNLKSQFLSIK